jgi:hypothetical protein
MNVLGWVLTAPLMLFLLVGAGKLLNPREKLMAREARLAWMGDFTGPQVKAIGALEVLGATGLVLPWLTGVARVLTPVAALGLAGLMAGATRVHARRGEREAFPVTLGLGVLALAVAVVRFVQL